MSQQPTRILLLGAGELGTALLTYLTTLPSTHVTLGIRTPSHYTSLLSSHPHLTLALIDLTSPSPLLANVFSNYTIIISATGFGAAPDTVFKLAEEVLLAGEIRKAQGQGKVWFFPWQWGVDYDITRDGEGLMPLFGAQHSVRNLLREKATTSNVQWTVVSTGIFMSFLFEAFWGIVQEGGDGVLVRCLRDWTHKVTVTDVSDIGRVLARIVTGDVDAEDKVVYVAGDTVSYGELAEIVGEVSGEEVEKEEWSIPYLEEELRKDPEDGIKKYRLVFARDGVWWDKERTVNHELGMEMMDVPTYARKLFSKQK